MPMMLKDFIKYQSLGNDFVIFDAFKRPRPYIYPLLLEPNWPEFVSKLCDRHFGVGADNVLLITHGEQDCIPEAIVFNANGKTAENCSNGVRSVAHYLFTHHNFPKNFKIKMADRVVDCTIIPTETTGGQRSYDVVTSFAPAVISKNQVITVNDQSWNGAVVNIGNPHFIIFEKITEHELAQIGQSLSTHEAFPHHTNVEFVWHTPTTSNENETYQTIIYERGCGITLACGSGAAAISSVLWKQGTIQSEQKIILAMPGGSLVCWVDQQGNVSLQASASLVFTGSLVD